MTNPHTLAIDIGGTGLKAAVLDAEGHMLDKRVRVHTPGDPTPEAVVEALAHLVARLPEFDRISIGFPGVVRRGVVLTAPNLGTRKWKGFALQDALSERFGKPARLENDAEVAGLGVIAGKGLEVVVTLGTGCGTAIFSDGRMTPHLDPFTVIQPGRLFEHRAGDAKLADIVKEGGAPKKAETPWRQAHGGTNGTRKIRNAPGVPRGKRALGIDDFAKGRRDCI